jgi:hypothetical protein
VIVIDSDEDVQADVVVGGVDAAAIDVIVISDDETMVEVIVIDDEDEAAEGAVDVGDHWACLKCTCDNAPFALACDACGARKDAVDHDIDGDAALARRMHDADEHAEAGRMDADTALAQQVQDEEEDVEAGRMHSEAEDGLAAVRLAGKEEEQEYLRVKKIRHRGDTDATLAQQVQEKEDRAEASRVRKRSEAEDAGLAAAVVAEEEEEQEEVAQGKKRRRKEAQEASNPSAEPAMLAAQLCEHLRSAAAAPRLSGGAASSSSSPSSTSSSAAAILPQGSIVNYDHAHVFLQRHAAELLASTGAKDKNEGKSTHISTGASSAKILIVYHGTAKTNFSKIVDGNLKVPDGKAVLHATDQGYYGKGVYTSPQKETALAYAARGGDGVVFVCLALPGRQYAAQYPADKGKPCHTGFDSHYSPEGTELVFFSSDQLLPIFLADQKHIGIATAAADTAISMIAAASGNCNPRGHIQR